MRHDPPPTRRCTQLRGTAAALGVALAVPLGLSYSAVASVPESANESVGDREPGDRVVANADAEHDEFDALVFSKTEGFRHDSIPDGIAAIEALGAENGFTVTATEDAEAFTEDNLDQYEVVVFLSTTGDVLNDDQQSAFESYIRDGGGFAGVHAASDTEFDWPWYGGLVGAYFDNHPEIQEATVVVEDDAHPSTAHLPQQWVRTDEWYAFQDNPRDDVHVLATLDESTYDAGDGGMGDDHPIAWCHDYDGGRSWYTGGGHTAESFTEPEFVEHLLAGIRTAAGVVDADCGATAEPGYNTLFDGTADSLENWRMAGPGGFELTDCGLLSQGGMGLYLYDEAFESYSLKLDWMMPGDDNSGVFVGFPDPGDDPWVAVDQGHEIQIDPTDEPDRTTGSIYTFQGADEQARDEALNPPGEWNAYEIVVEGDHIQVFLNDVKINDYTDTDPNRMNQPSYIGIQNHGDDDDVYFRDIRIQEYTFDSAATLVDDYAELGALNRAQQRLLLNHLQVAERMSGDGVTGQAAESLDRYAAEASEVGDDEVRTALVEMGDALRRQL